MIHVFGDSISYGHELKDCPHRLIMDGTIENPSNLAWPALIGARNWSSPGCSNEMILRNLTNFIHHSETSEIDLMLVQWSFPERFDVPILGESRITSTGHWIQGKKERQSILSWLKDIGEYPAPTNKQESDYIQCLESYYKSVYTSEFGLLKLLEYITYVQNILSNHNIEYYMFLPTYKVLLTDDDVHVFDRKRYEPIDIENKKETISLGYSINNDIVDFRGCIDWDRFICYNNDNPFYSILDRARETSDIGPEGHPLEDTHKEFANELRRRIF